MTSDNDAGRLVKTEPGRQPTTDLSPERERTDDGLREERGKTDRVVAARQREMARRADAMVHHARDTADAVLSAARDNADAVLDAARDKADDQQSHVESHADKDAIRQERAVADTTIQDERDCADEVLSEEREEYAKTLMAFLPLEREFTDRSLRSERIRADEALVNRDEFLAIVAHDLRDLLSGIMLSARLLAARAQQSEVNANSLVEAERIGRHAARMGRLIGDLVDIASIDAGKLAVTLAPGDLADPIAEAVDTFRSVATDRRLTLECQVEAPLTASFDHNRILQVLSNLISNAFKYTPHGGAIKIIGKRAEGCIHVTVSDTGVGIPAESLETVFERFAQASADQHGGLGLGLYISRCLVEAHGGTIEAKSTPGAGTEICMRFSASL